MTGSRRVLVNNPSTRVRAHRPDEDQVFVVSRAGLPGSQGPQGIPGDGAPSYAHHQISPSATWIITHNLNKWPDPILFLDDDPETPVWTDRFYPDLNHITLVLPEPKTGWAYLY